MLDKVCINNFRGIKRGEVGGFGVVNIITGPNCSGKTTLLEAIHHRHHRLRRPSFRLNSGVERFLWGEVVSSQADQRIMQAMNNVFPLEIEDFSYNMGLEVWLRGRDYALGIVDLGDGMKSALRVFILAATSDRLSTLCIEGVEAYQHTATLPEFAQELVNLVKESGAQLFMTAYSKDTIESFAQASEKAGLSFALIRVRIVDGVLVSDTLTGEDTLRLLEIEVL